MSSPGEKMSELFEITHRDPESAARTGILNLHGVQIETPVFMPVGTQGTVKAMKPEEVAAIGFRLVLGNTFHLHLRPGSERIERLGGLHRFMNWPHSILTDSGGYQVYSLAEIRKVNEKGVEFRSPHDGAMMLMTPEESIRIQHRLGSDIVMAFDECLPYEAQPDSVRSSMEMTLRWLKRCRSEHAARSGTGHLFGIVQGHFDSGLRQESACRTAELDLPGYAVGGLSVGEPENEMMEMLEASVSELPDDRPVYAMGIGLPMNLVDMVIRGVDMFDCVIPTRNARNGRVYTFNGVYSVKRSDFSDDASALEEDCPCDACRHYSRAYLRHLFQCSEILSSRLLTEHNLVFFRRLMDKIREAIRDGTLLSLRSRLAAIFGKGPPG
jgi:queuine tRNA-ribosyltransferase